MSLTIKGKIQGVVPVLYTDASDQGNTNLYVTDGTHTNWYAMRRKHMTNVKANDLLQITTRGQIRNDAGFNTEMAIMVTVDTSGLSSSYATTTPEAYGTMTSFQPISGFDVDPTIHYGRWDETCFYTVSANSNDLYITSWIRLRSTSADGSQSFTNQPDQAFMHILHSRS